MRAVSFWVMLGGKRAAVLKGEGGEVRFLAEIVDYADRTRVWDHGVAGDVHELTQNMLKLEPLFFRPEFLHFPDHLRLRN